MAKLKEYSLITLGIVLMVIGIYFFKFPNNFSFGGVTGVAVLLSKYKIASASDIVLVINVILLLVGLAVFGKNFGIKTAYASLLLSLLLSFLSRVFPMSAPLTDEPMLELMFAVLLPAVGSAILFNIGASSGGTDVIAKIMKKYTNMNIGRALLITDLVITLATFFVFDIKTCLFSMTGLIAKSLVIDNVIESFNVCKYFNIICTDPEPVCNFIVNELNRSATTFSATGAFSHSEKYIVLSVMNRHQALRLQQFIKQNDPDTFIMISNTTEIIGKGFRG